MATVIDSLLVTLGLDATKFKTGSVEVGKAQKNLANQNRVDAKERQEIDKKRDTEQRKHAKALNEQAKSNEESLRKVGYQALKIATLFTGGLGMLAFARNTLITGANLSRMSSNLGMSAKEISGWGTAARNAGFSIEGMKSSLMDANTQLGSWKSGLGSSLVGGYKTLGGDDKHGELNNAESFKLAEARLIKRLVAKNGEQVALAQVQHWMPGTSIEEFNFLKQGATAVKAQVDSQAKLSGITQKSAEQMAKMNAQLGTLKDQFQGVGTEILVSLIPAMEGLLKYLKQFGQWLNEHKEAIAKFSGDMSNWRDLLIAIIALKSASMFFGIARGIAAIGAAAIASGGSLGGLLASLGKGAPMLYMLYKMTVGADTAGPVTDNDQDFPTPTKSGMGSTPEGHAMARAIRNNNPGNLNFAGQAGASLETGVSSPRFAKFKTRSAGLAALARQLSIYRMRGKDIIESIIRTYAPSSENDTNSYIAYLSKYMGVSPSARLDLKNPATMSKLMAGIASREGGGSFSNAELMGAARTGLGQTGVMLPPSSMVGAQSSHGVSNSSNAFFGKSYGAMSTSDVKIGQISIVTQANNADGIARDIAPSIHKHLSVPQANSGLN